MSPKREYSSRRKDNPISVYFSPEVRELIEELAKEYPGIQSRSRIVETLAKYGLEQVRANKAAKQEYGNRLVSGS